LQVNLKALAGQLESERSMQKKNEHLTRATLKDSWERHSAVRTYLYRDESQQSTHPTNVYDTVCALALTILFAAALLLDAFHSSRISSDD
jgi:hypothetical protein